ncbi:hypothetical protein [Sodalis glossinidius]|uniref:hypothetical protein n=1 Tax=Sodalis glossinidius TaxID=63612 RepID=UPI0002FBA987|nr:hypothetical protein [Sodalis glossinidius]
MLLDERYVLKDSAQLRDYYAAPHPGVLHKQIDHVDDYARRLIARRRLSCSARRVPAGSTVHRRVANLALCR